MAMNKRRSKPVTMPASFTEAARVVRLVTLTGPGGVGKTRLAVTVAASAAAAFDGGVAFVPLASVQDSTLVPIAIADCIQVQESGGRPLIDELIARIESGRFLLILDNFEHLLTAAPLVTDLLLACPGLQVLTTSRRRLGLSSEHEIPVSPLAVVDPGRTYSVEALASVPAIQLFVARAGSRPRVRAQRGEWAADSRDLPASGWAAIGD